MTILKGVTVNGRMLARSGPVDPFSAQVVGIYKFEGNYLDSSSSANNLTAGINNTISTTTVKDGTGSLSVPTTVNTTPAVTQAAILFSGDFTIECWGNITNFVSNFGATIFSTRNSSGDLGFEIGVISGNQFIFSTADNAFLASASVSVSTGTWNYYTVERSSGTIRLYLNGVPVGNTPTYSNSFNRTLGIGGIKWFADRQFRGFIDNVRVTLAARYNGSSFTPPTTI